MALLIIVAYFVVGLLLARRWWRRKWRDYYDRQYRRNIDTDEWPWTAAGIVFVWPAWLAGIVVVRAVRWFFNVGLDKD